MGKSELNTERLKAIEEYKAGKYHGCVQEIQNCGLCLYRFSCKYIRYDVK